MCVRAPCFSASRLDSRQMKSGGGVRCPHLCAEFVTADAERRFALWLVRAVPVGRRVSTTPHVTVVTDQSVCRARADCGVWSVCLVSWLMERL